MRRSMKPSEEEKESKVPSTRRARSLLSISDITLRRSSRISKIMDTNPPEPSENARVTKSRASTVDRELGTPSSTSKRSVRAGSETKTMTPGRVLRKTRTSASSSEDILKDNVQTWKPYETSWSRKRLSMLPSEPSVAEEVQKSKNKEICVIEIDDDPIDQLSSTEKTPVTLDVNSSADQVANNSTEAPTSPDPSNSIDTTTSDKKDKSNGCDKKLTNIENENSFTLPVKISTFKPKRRSLMLLRREKEMNKDGTYAEYHFSESEDKIAKRMEREDQNSLQFEDSVIIEPQSRHDLKDPLADTSVTIVEEVKTTVKNKALAPKELSVTVEKLATDQWISSGKENTNPIESFESESDFEVNICDSLEKSSRNKSTQDSKHLRSENDLSDIDTDICGAKSKQKENIQRLNAVIVLKDILEDVRHEIKISGEEEKKVVTPKKKFNLSIKASKESEISEEKDEASVPSEIGNGGVMDGNGDDFVDWNNSTEAEERPKEVSSIETEKSSPGEKSELSLKSQEVEETSMEISIQETKVAVITVEENSETKKFEEESQKNSSPTVPLRKTLECLEKIAESPMRAEISPIRSESSIPSPGNSGKKPEEILGKELERSSSTISMCSLETIIYQSPVKSSETPLTQNSPLKRSTATISPRQLKNKLRKVLDFDIENVRNNYETSAIAEESPDSLNLQFEFESENVTPWIKSEVLQSEIEINENPLVEFPEDNSHNLNIKSELKQENLTPSFTTKESPGSLNLKIELEDSEIEIEDTFLEECSLDFPKETNPENLSLERSLSEEENNTLGIASKLKENGEKEDSDIEIEDDFLETVSETSQKMSSRKLSFDLESKSENGWNESFSLELQSEVEIKAKSSEPVLEVSRGKIPENLNLKVELKNKIPESEKKDSDKMNPLPESENRSLNVSLASEKTSKKDSDIEIEDSLPEFPKSPRKLILQSEINNSENVEDLNNSDNEMEEETSNLPSESEDRSLNVSSASGRTSEKDSDIEIENSLPEFPKSYRKLIFQSEINTSEKDSDIEIENSLPEFPKSSRKLIFQSEINTSEKDSDIEIENSLPEFPKSSRKLIFQSEINTSEIVEDSDDSDNKMKEETSNLLSESENRTPNVSSASGKKSDKESDIEIENEVSKVEEESLKESPQKSIPQSEINTSEIVEDADDSDNKMKEETLNLLSESKNRTQNVFSVSGKKSDNVSDIQTQDEAPKFEEESLKESPQKLSEEVKEKYVSSKKRRSRSLKFMGFVESDFSDEETEALETIANIKAVKMQEKESLRLKKELADLILKKESEVLKLREELTSKLNELNESNEDSIMEVVDFETRISSETENRESSIVAGPSSKQSDEKEEDLENLFKDITEEEFSLLRKNPSNLKGTEEDPVLLDEEVDELSQSRKKIFDDSVLILDDLGLDKSGNEEPSKRKSAEKLSVEFMDEVQSLNEKDNLSGEIEKPPVKEYGKSFSDSESRIEAKISPVKNLNISKSAQVSPSSNGEKKSNAPVVRKIEILKNAIEIESLKQHLGQLKIKEKEKEGENKENKKSLNQTENSKFAFKQLPFTQTPELMKLFNTENIKKEKTRKGLCPAFFMNFTSSEDDNSDFSIDTDAAMEYNLPGKRSERDSSSDLEKSLKIDFIDAEAGKCKFEEKIEESKLALEKKEKESLREKVKKNKEEEPEVSAELEKRGDDSSMSKKKKKKLKKEEPEVVEIEGREKDSSKKKKKKQNKEPGVVEMEGRGKESSKKKKNKQDKEPGVVEMEEREEEKSKKKKKKKKKNKRNKEELVVLKIEEGEEEIYKKKKKKSKQNKKEPEVLEIEEREGESSKKKNKRNKEDLEIVEIEERKEESSRKKNKRNKENKPEIEEDIVKEKKKKNRKEDEVGTKEYEIEIKPEKEKKRKYLPEVPENIQEISGKRKKNKKQKKGETMSEEIPKIEEDQVPKKKGDKRDKIEAVEVPLVKTKKKKSKKEIPAEIPQSDSVSSEKSDKKNRRREKTQVEFELQVSEPEKKHSKKEDENESKNQKMDIQEQKMKIKNQERRIKDQELKIKIQQKEIRNWEREIKNQTEIVKEKKKKSKPETKVENVDKKSIKRLPQEILESLSDPPQGRKRKKLSNLDPSQESTKPVSKKNIGKGLKTGEEEIIENPSDLPKQKIYVPSLSMTDTELREYIVEAESSEISFSGSTSKFLVSNVATTSNRQNRAEIIRNFRDNLLKRRVKRV